ncbi:YaaC family protein [Brumimicrobium aurantiacum]|uniref:Uncharacterized protein n=1 Tax=Brumimicrobium aurantiacum TaxID=1737063 RepID=A0A3E1EVW3_9FLAO|nr:YaaC family protein [Brumimicrobium aurantiacum]RFC53662.1 hypothetical protein DXU93_11070 [Brumimicrobium aurantiacum]
MGRKKIEFVEAKKKFTSVKYFPFGNVPGESYVLTSDPWNYLKAFLKNEHDSIKKKTEKLGPKKDKLSKALYFTELAESFQRSAENVQMPTKATLTYYSVLNIVKAFLLVRGHDLETNQEYHGLSLNPNDTMDLTISSNAKNGGINIFHEFAKELGYTVKPGTKISLEEMISNLPEIHELAYNLNLTKTSKRKFLPIDIEFLSNNRRWNKLTYRICFEKKHKHDYRIEKFKKGILSKILEESEDSKERVCYLSKQVRNLTHTSESSWKSNYNELCKEITGCNIRIMLTRVGYKYYLDLQPDNYSPLIYYFSLMFYIGSVARYRPTLNEEILEGQYKSLISEVLTSSPKQFLYLIAGFMTNKICAVPMANLN